MKLIVTQQLKQAVDIEVERCLFKAQSMVIANFLKPKYTFDLSGKTAGLALLKKHSIRLNASMLILYTNNFIDEVVAHEMAHLVAWKKFGTQVIPHGKEWQWLMRDVFEREPKTTHNFATRLARNKVFWYGCKCNSTREFSITRHRRATKGTKYICRYCKETMHFVESSPGNAPPPTNKPLPPTIKLLGNTELIQLIEQRLKQHDQGKLPDVSLHIDKQNQPEQLETQQKNNRQQEQLCLF